MMSTLSRSGAPPTAGLEVGLPRAFFLHDFVTNSFALKRVSAEYRRLR
jgi:hypothetical protein